MTHAFLGQVYLGIGSNIEPEKHIASCLNSLRAQFGALDISTIYRCKAVGFEGPDFFNLALGMTTDLDAHGLIQRLHRIEKEHGRDRAAPRFANRTLDIDLLLYDNLVVTQADLVLPREEILEHAFVLKPLAEIAPDYVHPVAGKSLRKLWSEFPQPDDDVTPI